DEESLGALMQQCGLERLSRWRSLNTDSAALPCSLNLEGYKRVASTTATVQVADISRDVMAVMSMPRLAFTENSFCVNQAVARLRIPIRVSTGVFWGQSLTAGI